MKKDETFENMIGKLEQIVASLEKGNCSLDESMQLFEEGVTLAVNCEQRLTESRQKILTLSGTGKGVQDD